MCELLLPTGTNVRGPTVCRHGYIHNISEHTGFMATMRLQEATVTLNTRHCHLPAVHHRRVDSCRLPRTTKSPAGPVLDLSGWRAEGGGGVCIPSSKVWDAS